MVATPKFKFYFTFHKDIIKTNWSAIVESPLKRAGLLVRRIERQAIRRDTTKKQRPSKPGRPPKSRHPQDLFRQIYSVPDAKKGQVLIGHRGLYGGQTVMEIHEFGQTATRKVRVLPGSSKRRRIKDPQQRKKVAAMYAAGSLRSVNKPPSYRTVTVRYPERKFAKPSLTKALPKIIGMWKNAVINVRGASVKSS